MVPSHPQHITTLSCHVLPPEFAGTHVASCSPWDMRVKKNAKKCRVPRAAPPCVLRAPAKRAGAHRRFAGRCDDRRDDGLAVWQRGGLRFLMAAELVARYRG
jgi:hypothetical protein